MNVIVTGANGFIGRWLVDELIKQDGIKVTALVRKGSNQIGLQQNNTNLVIEEVDYGQEETKEKFYNQDICIHLIGQMGKYGVSKEQFENINVQLTVKILQWCEHAKVEQFVFCSTPGVQGFGHRLAKEEDVYAPRNFYEKTKVQAEQEIISFCRTANIKYTIIRPDFVYGPGDYRRVKMYKNIMYKKFVLTTNGNSYLHPTYILDVIQGFIKSLGNIQAYNQIFNISAEKDVTALEYLETIAKCVDSKLIHMNIGYALSSIVASIVEILYSKLLQKDAFVSKNKIDFLAIDHSTSNQKAKKLIAYAPEYDITKGMRQTIQWCRQENLLS